MWHAEWEYDDNTEVPFELLRQFSNGKSWLVDYRPNTVRTQCKFCDFHEESEHWVLMYLHFSEYHPDELSMALLAGVAENA